MTSLAVVATLNLLSFWQFQLEGFFIMAISPVGSIVAYAGKAAPKGWMMCDGGAIPNNAAHAALIALVGQKTPDLRGYFLRGLDSRTNPAEKVDPDPRSLLSKQADSVGPHQHTYDRAIHPGVGKSGGDSTAVFAGYQDAGTKAISPDARETRPKNVAVNFIIKATDEG